jgi:predicted FMN-binding regulatory protein PaiB
LNSYPVSTNLTFQDCENQILQANGAQTSQHDCGLRNEITDIQSKFKLSQNRLLEDRQRVMIDELNRSNPQN